MIEARDWMVLLIGGPSGTGKSSLAYQLGQYYKVNVIELDDIHIAVEGSSTKEQYPNIHFWNERSDDKKLDDETTVEWLKAVSIELMPVIMKIIERHLVDRLPVIIEGDFLHPELLVKIQNKSVKTIFINETSVNQIIENYVSREGGERQEKRARVSDLYGKWISDTCSIHHINLLDARPWKTVCERAIKLLS